MVDMSVLREAKSRSKWSALQRIVTSPSRKQDIILSRWSMSSLAEFVANLVIAYNPRYFKFWSLSVMKPFRRYAVSLLNECTVLIPLATANMHSNWTDLALEVVISLTSGYVSFLPNRG